MSGKTPARRTRDGDPTNLGRPLTLTRAIQGELYGYLRIGMTQTDACDAANVPRSTYYAWLDRARETYEKHVGDDGLIPLADLTDEETRLLDFLDAITRARAVGKAGALASIRSGMGEDWRAAAWWLERSFPDEYGRRDHLAVESDERVEIRVVWPEELHETIDVEEIEEAEVE